MLVVLRALRGREGGGQPQLFVRVEVERRRHHAHDLVRHAVEAQGVPDEGGVGVEPPSPQALREDDDRGLARLVLPAVKARPRSGTVPSTAK